MLPERLFGHPDGLLFEPSLCGGHPCIIVRTGLVIAQAMLEHHPTRWRYLPDKDARQNKGIEHFPAGALIQ